MKIRKNNCLFCLNEFIGDYRKKFCNHRCAATYNSKKVVSKTNVCKKCGATFLLKKKGVSGFLFKINCIDCSMEVSFENQTKGSLYKRRKNWQSANSTLRNHARKIYLASTMPQKCFCGYDKYFEVCHIKPVKDFSDDAKVLEINSINNLISLCPTHHWEFDNGILNVN